MRLAEIVTGGLATAYQHVVSPMEGEGQTVLVTYDGRMHTIVLIGAGGHALATRTHPALDQLQVWADAWGALPDAWEAL